MLFLTNCLTLYITVFQVYTDSKMTLTAIMNNDNSFFKNWYDKRYVKNMMEFINIFKIYKSKLSSDLICRRKKYEWDKNTLNCLWNFQIFNDVKTIMRF